MFITKNNNETGRFTTPDLLWSAFPAQTPYHYTNINKIVFIKTRNGLYYLKIINVKVDVIQAPTL
jgi:hypothetical protein